MGTNVVFDIILIVILLILGYLTFFPKRKSISQETVAHNNGKDEDSLRAVSYKLTVPLRIQAYGRLILYMERIQFPVLVKRVFHPAISKNDFQFSLLQNVQDEFEHNIAQRLYVSETTWQLVVMAKEEALQHVNAVFGENQDADVVVIAQKLASFENAMVEKAVINIKNEFNLL